jgi:hypothetical protein
MKIGKKKYFTRDGISAKKTLDVRTRFGYEEHTHCPVDMEHSMLDVTITALILYIQNKIY